MPYIDSQGNIVESRTSILDAIFHFFGVIALFFQSLFGPFFGDGSSAPPPRTRPGGSSRFGGSAGGGGRWPGSGGPGGPSPGDESRGRRRIGGLPRSSGISAPPCSAGG